MLTSVSVAKTARSEEIVDLEEVVDEVSVSSSGDYCGWFGLPPTEEEMLSADPMVIDWFAAGKERLKKPNEGIDGGTFPN